jgi:hypothetical protein
MTADTIHTCSYSCERPECIRAQRDELAARLTAPAAEGVQAEPKAEAQLTYKGVPIGPMQTFADIERQATAPDEHALSRPAECSDGCPSQQVCDYCQAAALAQQPAADQFIATFRCEDNGIVGTTNAKIHSVTRHDDGVIEVVIDHWPNGSDAHSAEVEALREALKEAEDAMRFVYTSCATFPQEPRHTQNAAWRRIVNAITKARSALGQEEAR